MRVDGWTFFEVFWIRCAVQDAVDNSTEFSGIQILGQFHVRSSRDLSGSMRVCGG